MKQGFQKWKEKTSTSPSKSPLGYYKYLLIPYNNKEDITISVNNNMIYLHYVMINSSLSLGSPLNLWTTSEVIIILKESNNIQINRLRLINLYEVDYNLVLKLF